MNEFTVNAFGMNIDLSIPQNQAIQFINLNCGDLNQLPKVSIVILTKDNPQLLKLCLDSIKKQNVAQYEIIVGDTGSNYNTKLFYKKQFNNFSDSNLIKMVNLKSYHFSKNCNELVKKHVSEDSELILFLNDDVEFIEKCNALNQMVAYYQMQKDKVGTLGIELIFPTYKIQHQGIFAQPIPNSHLISVGHLNMNTFNYRYDVFSSLGNTGACLMISKELFNLIGGFPEDYISVFQDVALNIECLKQGKVNLTLCTAKAFHIESTTRKKDVKSEQKDNQMLMQDLQQKLSPLLRENVELIKLFILNQG